MFQDLQDVIDHVGKESKQSINRLANRRRSVSNVDDDTANKEWNAPLPSDDLDKLMWGNSGIPPPAPEKAPKYQKNWANNDNNGGVDEKIDDNASSIDNHDTNRNGDIPTSDSNEEDHKQAEKKKNDISDNILSALDYVEDEPQTSTINRNNEVNDNTSSYTSLSDIQQQPEDKIQLEGIVWKQRSGFGKFSFGILSDEWQQRRVVLYNSGVLKYYTLKKDMEGVKYDPSNATDPDISPWVYDDDNNQEVRGVMDIKFRRKHKDDVSSSILDIGEGMRRLGSSIVPTTTNNNNNSSQSPNNVGGVTIQGRERTADVGPTPYEIDIVRNDTNEMWRFCYPSQAMQIEWLTMLKSIALEGDNDVGEEEDTTEQHEDDDTNAVDKSTDGLDHHGFQPGDHIIRWEMLPVLYPIQIHGIVLEAGKNCVIIADFGLASYDNQRASGGGTTEALSSLSEDEDANDSHDVIMQAWEKLKPKEKKRLNVIVVTDPREIRKWSKINYGDQVEKDKGSSHNNPVGFLTSLLPGSKKKDQDTIAEEEDSSSSDDDDKSDDKSSKVPDQVTCTDVQQTESTTNLEEDNVKDEYIEGAPDWFQPSYRPRKRSGSSSSLPISDGQSVFSIDKSEAKETELPKSDSAKLVLARTNFILEHEDLLPPYHVFYSNSECIAVWCKTGRWSTLQAAVYLVSSSIGYGKTATMLTISVAAAHAILIPALAVGGLAVVGAPLLFLRKSQDKWDKTTMSLTESFWAYAEPEVYVEAIEYWARMGQS